jgi:hypothetical protein
MIGGERRTIGQYEDEWPDRYRGQHRSPRDHVLQDPGRSYSRKTYAQFLGRLPNHRGQEIRIAGFAAAPRQCHVAGPGVARPFGPADQKNGFGIGCENGGNRRPNERGVLVTGTGPGTQALGKASKPWLSANVIRSHRRNTRHRRAAR